MNKHFILAFRLRNTYRVNAIIYSLKSLPVVRKLLPSSSYASRGLKRFADIIKLRIIGDDLGDVCILQLFGLKRIVILHAQSRRGMPEAAERGDLRMHGIIIMNGVYQGELHGAERADLSGRIQFTLSGIKQFRHHAHEAVNQLPVKN